MLADFGIQSVKLPPRSFPNLDQSPATADHHFLREENWILHAQLGTRRLRFDDEQRRRLAVRAKLLGLRVLAACLRFPASNFTLVAGSSNHSKN
jgi:hypothetical protein